MNILGKTTIKTAKAFKEGGIMERNNNAYETIDEYIIQFPPEIQEILKKLRKVIKESAPDAEEKISYQMPAFALNGILLYFAAFKNHIGFFPMAAGSKHLKMNFQDIKLLKGQYNFLLISHCHMS